MKIQKFKDSLHHWMDTRKTFFLSYFGLAFILGFSLYEAQYFLTFPMTEFLEFVFAVLCVAFATAFLLLANNKFIKALGFLLFFVTMGLNVFYSGHHIIYGTPPTSNVYVSLFETNTSETWEFLEAYVTADVYFKLALEFLVSLALFFSLKKFHSRIHRGFLYTSMIFFFLAPMTLENLKFKSPYRFVNQYFIYSQEKQNFRKTFSKDAPSDLKVDHQDQTQDDTVILVVGESVARQRLSLYGYPRKTSPLLEKQDLFVFKNVISPHSHTVPSLEKALTFLNFDNQSTLKSNANIIQLARLSDYRTYWISNQPPLGKDETPLNIMANNADKTFWLSDSPSFRYNNNLDGSVVPLMSRILDEKSGKKFIVIHLIGAHTSYKHRSPRSFKVFEDEFPHKLKLSKEQWKDYNNYDNAILYNDFVVNSIVEAAKKKSKTTVIYFSDHGEEVYDNRYIKGHTEALSSNVMFEVPFIVYSNNPPLKAKLQSHMAQRKDSLWSIEDLIHSLHDVFNIQSSYYEPQRSLFSEDFKEIPRLIAGKAYGSNSTVDCLAKGMFTPTDKIWVHRVNTLERLEILKDDFAGFEIDMVWDTSKGYLDVYHPPVKSINLNVRSMLAADQSGKKYFWFDLKNLNESNVSAVVAELKSLDEAFKIKSRIIVESDKAESLKSISEAGFYTSFYLPNQKNLPLGKYVSNLSARIASYHNAISQSGSRLELMDAKFSSCDKLLWIIGDDSEDHDKIDEVKARQDVKVILVRKKTDYRR